MEETGNRKRRTAEELLADLKAKKEKLANREKTLKTKLRENRQKAQNHAKILAGAALITFLKKNPSRALSVFADRVHDYETIRESFPALPSFDTLKTTSSLPAGVTSMRLVDGELRSFDAQGRRIPTAE